MTELQQMFYRKLRSYAIIHGNPVQQLVLRIGLAIDKYSRYPDMVQAFLILTCDTGRCDEDSINPPAVEGFDNPHLLVGIIMGGAENHTEASRAGHFFDAFYHIIEEGIGNRRNHQANRARPLRLQALRNSVTRITQLIRELLDALSCVYTNQRASTKRP